MFPWEKRALSGEGSPLTKFEKAYWVVFVGAMAFLGIKLVWQKIHPNANDDEDKEEQARREAEKKERAMHVLMGNSAISGEDDPFEGLSPEEIDAYVKSSTKHSLPPEMYGLLPKLQEEDEFEVGLRGLTIGD